MKPFFTLMAVIAALKASLAGFIVTSPLPDLSEKVSQTFKFPAAPDGGWRYYIVPVTADAPIEFKQGSLNLGKGDFAGPNEGYNDVDAHGWPCKRLEKKEFGVTYRVYRLLQEPHGAFELTVVTEEIK